MTRRRVAVLGAGIMGGSTALHLARLGIPVTVFDHEDAPFRGASRWNEGKIHLGFLYGADPTLDTARAVLPGGLDFKDQVEALTGIALGPVTTPADDLYLVHRDSVTAPEAVSRYYAAVAELVRSHPEAHRYLTDASRRGVELLSPAELFDLADPSVVVAGFRVPERSVNTNRVADAFVDALDGEPLVELRLGRHVTGVAPAGEDPDRWVVHTTDGRDGDGRDGDGPFGAVVNALWEGRPRIDRTVGHRPDVAEHHRYRVSLFVRTATALESPSAVVAVGAFGDVKTYSGRDFYLSWYATGLLARAEAVDPPPVPALSDSEKKRIATQVFAALGDVLPWVRGIELAASEVRVEGGWVYSQGGGSLDDPIAAVHRRNRLGITRLGSYFSVDTGKYSVAPTLAERLARAIAETV
jgi:glycine/D-amino acid oxidase-like deaminating enzyme